jgi:hypothetical protein
METARTLEGKGQGDEEGEVIPYVPGSSDPAAEGPWERPVAHRVEYRLVTRESERDDSGSVNARKRCGTDGRSRCVRATRLSVGG